MVIERYPRLGQPLAPATLRSVLDVPVPRHLTKKLAPAGLREMRLADLDATAWKRFGLPACRALAKHIVKQVRQATAPPTASIRRQPLPRIEKLLTIDDLRLEVRTRNCLGRAGFADDLRPLSGRSINNLLRLRRFGARCLVDLLASLEMSKGVLPPPDPPPPPCPLPPFYSPLLPPLSWAEWAWGDFPHLPKNAWEWLFPALPADLTLEQMDVPNRINRCLRASSFGIKLCALGGHRIIQLLEFRSVGLGALRSFLRALDATLHPPSPSIAPDLETELLNVFLRDCKDSKTKLARNRRIFMRFYGLDGQGGTSLGTIGDAEGISRERVRQVCLLRPRLGCSLPRLKSVLQVVAELLPAPAAHIEAELLRRGLIAQHLPLKSLGQFARALQYPLPFRLTCIAHLCWAVSPDKAE